ncbi:MAG: methionine biosynthesis protein MetW [Pseudomonadota bacterium]
MSVEGAPLDHVTTPERLDLATIRPDLRLIAELVSEGARVLDVGCGDGALLELLTRTKAADARGMEISQNGVNAAVARGLSVIQGDADTDLKDYPDKAFDFVILTLTIQATRNPRAVLQHLLRIGRRGIVSFPNFGHWRVRASLAFEGRMPRTSLLDEAWYDTPNIHLCTIRDFVALCHELGLRIDQAWQMDAAFNPRPFSPDRRWANLAAEQALFLLEAKAET